MEFIDRVSAYPGRYMLTDENGNTSYVILERADEPVTTGTPLNAETFSKIVSKDGDTMNGMLFFENMDAYHVYQKFREVNGRIFGVNAGCGVLGGRGVVAFEIREGTDTTSPRLARLEFGELGVSYIDPNGKRTYLHESGVLPATLE